MVQEKFDKNKVWSIYRDIVQFGISKLEGMTEFECLQIKLFATECKQKGFIDASIIYGSYLENNSSALKEIPIEFQNGREIEYFGLKHCNYYQDGNLVLNCIDKYLSNINQEIQNIEPGTKSDMIDYQKYAKQAANSVLDVFPNWEYSKNWESLKSSLIKFLLSNDNIKKHVNYKTKLIDMVNYNNIFFDNWELFESKLLEYKNTGKRTHEEIDNYRKSFLNEKTYHPNIYKNECFKAFQDFKKQLTSGSYQNGIDGEIKKENTLRQTVRNMVDMIFSVLLTDEYLKIIGEDVKEAITNEQPVPYTEKQFALTYKLLVDKGVYPNPRDDDNDGFKQSIIFQFGKDNFGLKTAKSFEEKYKHLSYYESFNKAQGSYEINDLLSQRIVKLKPIDFKKAKEIERKYLFSNHLDDLQMPT